MAQGLDASDVEAFERLLKKMPDIAAPNLVRVLKRNLLDHLDETMRGSSFRPQAKRGIKRSFTVYPRGRVQPRRLEDVKAGSFTSWKGAGVDDADSPQAAARVLEKRLGRQTIRPESGRYLAIPAGALRTPTGRIKRRGGKRATVKDANDFLPGNGATFRVRRGRNFLVYRQTGTKRRRDQYNARTRRMRKRVQVVKRELIGVLAPRVQRGATLDWVGAWDRLESKRRDRYQRFLADVLAGRLRR